MVITRQQSRKRSDQPDGPGGRNTRVSESQTDGPGAADGDADPVPDAAAAASGRMDARRGRLIGSATLREAARLAALETELRVLGDLASAEAIEELQPYLDVGSPRVRTDAVIRSQRDQRFNVPRSRLKEVLKQFSPRLERALTAPSTLIVVAHQDDESIGAGAQLARLQDVMVVHVTDGAPRDPEYARRFGYTTASEYGEVRRREAGEALKLVGVPEERQFCLGIPDGEAPFHLVDLSLSIAEMIDELKPEVLLTHPYEGGHTDHDATAFAVHLACGILRREGAALPVVLELTGYHNRGGRRVVHEFLPFPGAGPARSLRLSKPARELKARMYECFRTQQKCLQQFSVDVERFRPAPRYVFTKPPHEGPLDYERLSRRMTGEEWRRQADRALGRLRTRGRTRTIVPGPLPSRTSDSSTTAFLHAAP